MKKLLALVTLAASAVTPFTIANGQPQKPPAVQAVQQPKPDPAQEAKAHALQTEVHVMREFTQHILSTVYFALGTVIVVLIAMVGFGWYQNFRVYERDREALRQSLLNTLNDETRKGFGELDNKATARFKSFDERMATAIERNLQRLADVQLMLEASIFRTAHAPKTPRTDFLFFSEHVERSIGHVTPGVLDHALSTVLDYVQTTARIDPPTRTSLLTLASKVVSQNPVFGERLRELLAGKPE